MTSKVAFLTETKRKLAPCMCTLACCVTFLILAIVTMVQRNAPYQVLVSGPIVEADLWGAEPLKLQWLSGGFGFDNTINIGLEDTTSCDEATVSALLARGGAYVSNSPAQSAADVTCLKCASGEPPADPLVSMAAPPQLIFAAFNGDPQTLGENLDGTPLCFSWPYLG